MEHNRREFLLSPSNRFTEILELYQNYYGFWYSEAQGFSAAPENNDISTNYLDFIGYWGG